MLLKRLYVVLLLIVSMHLLVAYLLDMSWQKMMLAIVLDVLFIGVGGYLISKNGVSDDWMKRFVHLLRRFIWVYILNILLGLVPAIVFYQEIAGINSYAFLLILFFGVHLLMALYALPIKGWLEKPQ